jgi:signal transduction histidine kinase
MIGSLCLLAGFEYVWLRSEYSIERKLLEEQQTLNLHTAIRELEDSLFHSVIVEARIPDDTTGYIAARVNIRSGNQDAVKDTSHLVKMIRHIHSGDHDSLRVRRMRSHRGATMLGTLVNQTSGGDSIHVAVILDKMIMQKLQATGTETGASLVTWNSTQPETGGLVSKPFYDFYSGTHYALLNADYRPYLLRQMIPQMLFALLLFGCISGAFWTISRSLRKQRNLAMMRSNLISNISHELKTPISTVRVALESLEGMDSDGSDLRRKEYLAIAQSEVGRLSLLVDKVLKSSRLDETTASLKIERFDLHTLAAEVLETLKVQFARHEAHVELDRQGEDFSIEADKLHITGLIHNLLDNALKYGGAAPQVRMSLARQNGELLLRVSDSGPGIPRQYQPRIFDKFFRVPGGDVHDIKGHGLGLSYVAQVVREHGGTVTVESPEGQGTTFTVSLPQTHAS